MSKKNGSKSAPKVDVSKVKANATKKLQDKAKQSLVAKPAKESEGKPANIEATVKALVAEQHGANDVPEVPPVLEPQAPGNGNETNETSNHEQDKGEQTMSMKEKVSTIMNDKLLTRLPDSISSKIPASLVDAATPKTLAIGAGVGVVMLRIFRGVFGKKAGK